MGNFNEIPKGLPDLGKNYWQEFNNQDKDINAENEIVSLNCQTIFNPENANKNIKPSIFKE